MERDVAKKYAQAHQRERLNEEKLDDKDIFDCHFEKAIDSKLNFCTIGVKLSRARHHIEGRYWEGSVEKLRQQIWQFSGFDGGMSGRMTATAFIRSDRAEVQE